MSNSAVVVAESKSIIRLDLGCGKSKRKDGDWIGVDSRQFDGVDFILDLAAVNGPNNIETGDLEALLRAPVTYKRWPWDNDSVEEAHCSHFVEHLTASERIHFVNELYRILKPGCKATIITPHWASCRAYGDLTHQWPPVSEFWWYYLSKPWRADNAPHNDGYTCDFEAVWGYGMRPDVAVRPPDFQQFAMANYKEAITDMQCTLTKK